MAYLPRALASRVRQACRTFPAVLVTGPRQSGKTTLLCEEFGKTHAFVSLERPDVRARVTADPIGFLREHPPPLILDEIQYVPELLHYIKEEIERQRTPGAWLLSGSQSLPLMRGVSQTLAGRVAVLALAPLSVREAEGRGAEPERVEDALDRVFGLGAGRGRGHVDLGDWLLRGGYPELRASPAVDRQLWFASYVQTYLQRDVRDLLQIGDLGTFSRFLSLAAARTGCLLNLADLSRDVGVSPPTVRRWLSVLEASQIIYLLRPFHANFGKRLVKSPRLIFTDPGLAAFLVGLHDRDAILAGPSAGALVETAVVGEWLKLFRQQGEEPALSFWRSSSGIEVDLVIERNRCLYGIEVKATATPTPGHGASLATWLSLAGKSARGALACDIDVPESLRPGIRAVPWHLAW